MVAHPEAQVYTSSLKVRSLKSRALSTRFNPRNLRTLWYPAWNQVFADLFQSDANISVSIGPQMALRLSPNEDVPDSDNSAQTQPDVGMDVNPTFGILHVRNKPMVAPQGPPGVQHRAYVRHAGLKTTHSCNCSFGEITPAPSRHTDNDGFELGVLLVDAVNHLVRYANLHFLADEKAPSALLWAIAGPFWTYRVVKRADVPAWEWNLDRVQDREALSVFMEAFSQPFEICTPESDAELQSIYEKYFQKLHLDDDGDGDDENASDNETDEGY